MKGVVTSYVSPRSYLIQAENGRFYGRNRAHLKPRSSAEGNSAQQSSGFTGDEDLPAEFHPPVTQSSSPKKAVPKTPDNRSTGKIFQDSPYRTPRTPTPLQQQTVKAETERIIHDPIFSSVGFLIDNVYQGNPQTIEELKTAITAKIRAIPKEECRKVIRNFARRLRVCLQRNGGHLEHILGKS
ncbi:hypothetical protein QYM36_001156 [Artemia franciscana]|uniref:Uncharacterized protein n=1 Tax=Artemia franciscana TaxID=6661 RepID=A0AA88IAM3_ARTSF|nr:hypothetical protein QYM36_001156 [Artemia franciscana]